MPESGLSAVCTNLQQVEEGYFQGTGNCLFTGKDNNACGKRNEGLQTVLQKAAADFVYSGQREDSCGLELNIFYYLAQFSL